MQLKKQVQNMGGMKFLKYHLLALFENMQKLSHAFFSKEMRLITVMFHIILKENQNRRLFKYKIVEKY